MLVTTGTATTAITAMRIKTAFTIVPFAVRGTFGTAEAPESAAGSAPDMGFVLTEFGKLDTQGPRIAQEDSDAVAT